MQILHILKIYLYFQQHFDILSCWLLPSALLFSLPGSEHIVSRNYLMQNLPAKQCARPFGPHALAGGQYTIRHAGRASLSLGFFFGRRGGK